MTEPYLVMDYQVPDNGHVLTTLETAADGATRYIRVQVFGPNPPTLRRWRLNQTADGALTLTEIAPAPAP